MSSISLAGQIALVTGAGRGLGRAYALDLASRGATVIVNDLGCSKEGDGSSNVADQVVQEIVSKGGKAVASYLSVEYGDLIVKQAMESFGRIDILINNAGNAPKMIPFEELSEEEWESVYRVHLRGTMSVTLAAWPHMATQKYGRIIVISSSSGLYGSAKQCNYSSAKLGLCAFSKLLSQQGLEYNILVNTVAPLAFTRFSADYLPLQMEAALNPSFVSPLTTYLSSQSCNKSGLTLETGAGFTAAIEWEDVSISLDSSIELDLSQKTVLIIGSSSQAVLLSEKLSQKCGLVLHLLPTNSDQVSIQRADKIITARGSLSQLYETFQKMILENTKIGLLINLSSLDLKSTPFDVNFQNLQVSQWKQLETSHFRPLLSIFQIVWKSMKLQGEGNIIQYVTDCGVNPSLNHSLLSIYEHILVAFNKSLGLEGSINNIRVHIISQDEGQSNSFQLLTSLLSPKSNLSTNFAKVLCVSTKNNAITGDTQVPLKISECRPRQSCGINFSIGAPMTPEMFQQNIEEICNFSNEGHCYPSNPADSFNKCMMNIMSFFHMMEEMQKAQANQPQQTQTPQAQETLVA